MKFEPIVKLESPLPDFLDNSSETYDETRVKSNSFLHLFDKKDLYTPASLVLNQPDYNEAIEWILWVKMPFSKFLKLDTSSEEISTILGHLFSPVIMYDNTENLEIKLVFENKKAVKYPNVEILNNHSELYNDFVNGMPKEKYLLWQNRFKS